MTEEEALARNAVFLRQISYNLRRRYCHESAVIDADDIRQEAALILLQMRRDGRIGDGDLDGGGCRLLYVAVKHHVFKLKGLIERRDAEGNSASGTKSIEAVSLDAPIKDGSGEAVSDMKARIEAQCPDIAEEYERRELIATVRSAVMALPEAMRGEVARAFELSFAKASESVNDSVREAAMKRLRRMKALSPWGPKRGTARRKGYKCRQC